MKCAQCHGAEGKGDGPAAPFVFPKPRNFTSGTFKIRTTGSGELPTDDDLFRVISKGMPGTSMPAWEGELSEKDRWVLVHDVKSFSPNFADAKPQPVRFGRSPRVTAKLMDEGKTLYEKMQCFQCHGKQGRGDGPSALTLMNDWGEPIYAADLTQPWNFRGGLALRDIFLRFTTGMNGTPMPAFTGAFDPENPKEDERLRWALAAYVQSLGRKPHWDFVIKGKPAKGRAPADPTDPAWQPAPMIDVPLAGQVVREPRNFAPNVNAVTIQALYDDKTVALRITWDDRTMTVSDPPDAVSLQFPVGLAAGGKERPYFLGGDPDHPVNLWYWDARSGKASDQNSSSLENPVAQPAARQDLLAGATYYEGRWQVVFQRSLQTSDAEHDVQLAPGVFVPIAFSVWEGASQEAGNKRAISAWLHLVLEPPTPVRVYIFPPLVAVAAGALEIILLGFVRKKSRTAGGSTG